MKHLKTIVTYHIELLNSSVWKGLPELTNADGRPCRYSCNVQAWSAATLIEALHDLNRF